MGAQAQGWFMNQIRLLFSGLDALIYGLIKWILYGIFDLSKVTGNSEIFGNIYVRIYIILGIFMAFKLSFSFFQYILDPDSMTKGDKSLTQLGSRVFIMIAALVFLPTFLFGTGGLLNRAQQALLPVLPKVIFGVETIGGGNVDNTVEASSQMISLTTLKSFFAPAEDLDDYCGAGTFDKTPEIMTMEDFHNNLNEDCNVKGTGIAGIAAKKVYKYHYTFFISSVVGLLVAVLLLGVTLDIAKRIFKLIILEIIAPIPIMSLIDPKGSKDGAFSHWIKSLTTTFLDIFFKMGIVYVVVVFIQLIVQRKLFADLPATGFRGAYLTVLLILGLIFFAKEAPKFIKDAIGIKDTGGGLFDDVKSIGKAAGVIGGAAIGGAAALGGNISAAATAIKEGHGLSGALTALNSPGALLAGAIRGGKNGLSGAGKGNTFKGWSQAASSQRTINASRLTNAAAGSTALGRTGARLSSLFTGQTAADRDETRISAYKSAVDSAKNFKSVLADSAGKSKRGLKVNGHADVSAREFKGLLAAANSGDRTAVATLSTKYGYSSLAEANAGAAEFEKDYQKAYFAAIQKGDIDAKTDGDAAAVLSAKDVADADIRGLHLKDISGKPISSIDASNSGAVIGAATTAGNKIKSNKKYISNKQNAAAIKKSGK